MEREQASFQKEKARFHQQQKQQRDSKQSQQQQQQQQQQATELNPNLLKDAYEILGVPQGANLKQCKTAYRSLMGIYHPDKRENLTGSRKKEAEEQAVLINVAWDTAKKALG